jgi:hypothetical protein
VQPHGVILIIHGSKNVTVDHNLIDARANANSPHLILVTAGGEKLATPTEVTVSENVLVNGASTRTWYLQPGSGPAATGNVVVAAEAAAGK